MARRHWTVVVVSDDEARIRQFRFSRELVRSVIGVALLGVALLASLGAGILGRGRGDFRLRRMTRENRLLREQVTRIRSRTKALDAELVALEKQDRAFRLVAGLQPLSSDVLQAGIGGPGGTTLADDALFRLDPEIGRVTFRAHDDIETLVRRAALLSSSWAEAQRTLRLKQARFASTPSIMPARGFITSGFTTARFHPILNITRPHEGIDVTAPVGTPIHATGDGVVSFVGRNGGYGLMVEIDHGHGLATRYAHASRAVVRVGQRVTRGQKIAEVGESGLAIGPHVHYEVLVDGKPQDPRHFILLGEVIPD